MNGFEKKIVNGVVVEVVNLSKATYEEAQNLNKILDNEINFKNRKIVVDLSQCEFIDSTFLGVLVLSLKSIARIGGDIRLIKPYSINKSLMSIAGTLNVFNVYNSLEEAINSFNYNSIINYYLAHGAGIMA
jgi:anti-anti-sigma factor